MKNDQANPRLCSPAVGNVARPNGLLRGAGFLPVPLLIAATLMLWRVGSPRVHESIWLAFTLNFVISALISFFVAYLIARSFLARSTPASLMLGCGTLVWGCAGPVGLLTGMGVFGQPPGGLDGNTTITIHNLCAFLSAACFLAGAVLSLKNRRVTHSRTAWLVGAYAAALSAVAVVVVAALESRIPTFFVQGQGGTPLRQFVLGSAIAMLVATAMLLVFARHRPLSAFIYWFALALLLLACGLFGVSLQSAHGTALNWIGRATQLLGVVYMLIAAIASVRESQAWEISIEAVLRRTEERYHLLFENMAEGFALHEIITDEQDRPCDYRFLEVNPAFERLTGLKRNEILGRRVSEVLPDDDPHWIAIYGEVALTGNSKHVESFSRPLNRWFDVVAYSPASRQFAVIFKEITARKKAEAILRRYELLAADTRDVILFMRASDGRILEANAAACHAYGYSREELLSLSVHDLRAEQQRAGIPSNMAQAELHGVLFETVHRRRNGEIFPVEVSSRGAEIAGERTLISVVRDITDRKQAEDALRQNGERFKLLAEVSAELLRTKQPQAILEELCRKIMAHLGCDCFFNFLVDSASERLHLNACAGIPPEEVARLEWLDYGVAVCGCVARCGERIIVEDIQNACDPRTELVKAYGIQAYACHPLLDQGRVIGTLSFGSRARPSFRPDELELMRIVAGQVSTAIHRIMMEQERQSFLEAERAARTEAERLVRLKDEFLATVSHELRSPLSAIVGWTRLLARGSVESDKAVDIIDRSASSLTRIVEDLLDMSRMISGKIRLNCEKVDVLSLVMNAVESVQFAAEARGVQIQVASDDGLWPLECDSNRIQQVVWNLLANAIKFTPSGGRVRVSVNQGDGHLRIEVADTGQGISPDFLPHMFERFRQQDGSTTRQHGGLGLGLAIVKQLVELHGGTVGALSDGPGKGSTFVVTLPCSVPHDGLRGGRPPCRIISSTGSAYEAGLLDGVRVLAVDDDPQGGELLVRLLRESGAIVELVGSAEAGLELLDTFKPDAVISDVGMPELDGYDFVRQIRARVAGRTLPCVALTALARPEDRAKALEAGFDEHLAKPYDPNALPGTIGALLARGRAGQPGNRNGSRLVDGARNNGTHRRNGSGPAHILLAEDNTSISQMLQIVLESEGYRVSVAESLADAVDRANEEPVSLLLSDLRLRDGMGWDLLAKLRARREVPGIVMSGYSEEVYMTRSKAAGFADFLVKPVDTDELLAAIRRVLAAPSLH